MIELYDIKPCADYRNTVQAEGQIRQENFSLNDIEQLLRDLNFKVFSLGEPLVLICKSKDCQLLVSSNGSFNISEVSSEEKLFQIIEEIESKIII